MKNIILLKVKLLLNNNALLLKVVGRPYAIFLSIIFLLTACTPSPTPLPATATAMPITPTQTEIPATLMPTMEPSPTATNIPTATPIPCDAYESFCIEDAHFWLARPISRADNNEIERGYRYGSTINGKRDPHHGVEFINAFGVPILAAANGRVIYAAEDKPAIYSPWERFYGNLIVIEHDLPELDAPLYTLYAHLSEINVAEGEVVEAGQPVGNVGMSGRAIGSHLHFEVRVRGDGYSDTRNPELWLQALDVMHGGIVVRIENQTGKLIRVPLVIDKVGGAEDALERVASLDAYAPETHPVGVDDNWAETHAIGDIPAGEYRVSFSYAGQYWERFVNVHPDKVTTIYFLIEE
jgi:hypothetical protein